MFINITILLCVLGLISCVVVLSSSLRKRHIPALNVKLSGERVQYQGFPPTEADTTDAVLRVSPQRHRTTGEQTAEAPDALYPATTPPLAAYSGTQRSWVQIRCGAVLLPVQHYASLHK